MIVESLNTKGCQVSLDFGMFKNLGYIIFKPKSIIIVPSLKPYVYPRSSIGDHEQMGITTNSIFVCDNGNESLWCCDRGALPDNFFWNPNQTLASRISEGFLFTWT